MSEKLLLSELNLLIRDALLEAFPDTVWVVAEISELKENRTGHCYLELIEKDEVSDEITARARATIWSYTFRMLKPYFETTTGQLFTSGIKVLVQAAVEFHPAYGFSLNIKDIDPTYTVGDMVRRRNEIINRLKTEGVFDMNRELPLPEVPQKIAIISSATAAGYQDFINQLENNTNGFVFYHKLFEAFMQGSEATPSIINALERIYDFEDFFDLVVIIRGGGAQADLSCFDNYDLALNITQFPLPVLTGIGHEKDDTIIDLVAHTRLKTPTAVAEFLIAGMERFYENLLQLEAEIVLQTREKIEEQNSILEKTAENLQFLVSDFIYEKNIQLIRKGNKFQQEIRNYSFRKSDELNNFRNDFKSGVSLWSVKETNYLDQNRRILKRIAGEHLLKEKGKLIHFSDSFQNKVFKFMQKENERIHLNENSLRLLDPENVLLRGYTLTLKDGKIIKSADELSVNETIETRFTDGKIKSKILNKQKYGNKKGNL
ncbi:MAG: exodeoxyribonuclease VII large subunit [Prolixibacteraceae bacterium]|nr:exodeoxyribonuclease VII large subunit [Prolixibacteraceae bacterium]MBN2773381.1 exodeoxyribonuclease VII large subunit [Prolixibacteraceae bacterium]